MGSSHYSELYNTTHKGLGSLQPHATDFSPELHRSFDQYPHNLASWHHAPTDDFVDILPTQYTTAYNPPGIFSVRDNWRQLQVVWSVVWSINPALIERSQGHGPLVSDRSSLMEIFPVQPQVILSYHHPHHQNANEIHSSAPICPTLTKRSRPTNRIP
jgi:hypothetical protein